MIRFEELKDNKLFKGIWIPKELLFDDKLSITEKLVLIEITYLDNDDNYCFASNEYLARLCGCSKSKVTDAVTKLLDLKYITLISFDGRIRKLKSNLHFCLHSDS